MSIIAGQKAPASPTRRTSAPRKRGDDTRAKIIDETVRCIAEEGFAAATAKHVAERAGVTWGVIQYHFGDRNGLLMAVVDDGVARLLESLSSADVTASSQRYSSSGPIEVISTTGRSGNVARMRLPLRPAAQPICRPRRPCLHGLQGRAPRGRA